MRRRSTHGGAPRPTYCRPSFDPKVKHRRQFQRQVVKATVIDHHGRARLRPPRERARARDGEGAFFRLSGFCAYSSEIPARMRSERWSTDEGQACLCPCSPCTGILSTSIRHPSALRGKAVLSRQRHGTRGFSGTFASVRYGFYRETRNPCRETRPGRRRLVLPASSGKPPRATAADGPPIACVHG